MVIPELLTAAEALDEDEQRALAEALSQFADDDDIEVTEEQQKLIRTRHEEMNADPTIGLTREQGRARMRGLLGE